MVGAGEARKDPMNAGERVRRGMHVDGEEELEEGVLMVAMRYLKKEVERGAGCDGEGGKEERR